MDAALWYQPISHRWAKNLAGVRGAEPRRCIKMYRAMPGRQTAVRLTAMRARIAPAAEAPATQEGNAP